VRALAIVHQRDAGPGVFAHAVGAAGADLETWLVADEPSPPSDLRDYAAVLTFGGAMHADQESEHAWLAAEKRLLAELLERGVPLLGVCLGAQLVAEAGGAPVRRAPAPEIGWCAVETTTHAVDDPLLGPLAPGFAALEWHSYEFGLPERAVPLASSDVCLQAFRLGETAWGIQFHAEVTHEDFDAWIDDYRSDPDAVAVGLDTEALRAKTREAIAGWNELGRGICERFIALAAALG
jgi:GMP synthase (glutamine-hydrolysing)